MHNFFLKKCFEIANKSNYRSTKVGALLVKNGNVIATGYNSIPFKLNSNIKERFEPPLKYIFFEHAERNCIYFCARHGISTNNSTMYVNLCPCTECSRAIIEAGIKKVVFHSVFSNYALEKWKLQYDISKKMFKEANIELIEINTKLNCVGLIGRQNVSV